MVRPHRYHNAGVNTPTKRMPNAITQPARATPRSDRRKKGLATSRNNQASMSGTPSTTDHACDSGSIRNPQRRSKSSHDKNVTATIVSNTRNNHFQPRIEFTAGALMLSGDEGSAAAP